MFALRVGFAQAIGQPDPAHRVSGAKPAGDDNRTGPRSTSTGGCRHDGVLGPRPADWRQPGECSSPDGGHDRNNGKGAAQPHGAQRMATALINGHASTQEQQRLEETVGHQMQRGDARKAGANRHKHQTEVCRSRGCQHLLDVGLQQSHDPTGKRRCAADGHKGHAEAADRREPGLQPRQQVGTGSHHRRRMEQRRHRRRSGHGAKQPGRKRDLPGLGHGRQHDAKGNDSQVRCVETRQVGKGERAAPGVGTHRRQKKAGVAEAGHDKSVARRTRIFSVAPFVGNEGPGTGANDLPADQQCEQIVGHDEQFHRAAKKQQQAQQPDQPGGALAMSGIHQHRQGDGRHERGDQCRERRERGLQGQRPAPTQTAGPASCHSDRHERQRRRQAEARDQCQRAAALCARRQQQRASYRGKQGEEPEHQCLSVSSASVVSAWRWR